MKKSPSTTPRSPGNHLSGRLWKIGLGLFLVLAGTLSARYLWNTYERASQMDDWVATPCEIVSADIDDSRLNQRGLVKYGLDVVYRYEFDGNTYTGDRVRRLPVESSDPKKAARKLEKYPAGSETVCYVDPDRPVAAVLEKDSKASLYSIWFPGLFIVGGIGMILSALFRKSR
ncbi:MAG: DUF3592 domain-containing protein [Verrucomicrobiales bacterium]